MDFLWSISSELTAVVITGVVFNYFFYPVRQRLRKKRMEKRIGNIGERVAVMVVTTRGDISPYVLKYIKSRGLDISAADFIVVKYNEIYEKDWGSVVGEVKEAGQAVKDRGFDTLYLFVHAPIAIGVLAGAVLDNGPLVKVHHWDGQYREVARLGAGTVLTN